MHKISVCGPLGSCRTTCARSLVQDLSGRVSAPRYCRTTCARCLYQDSGSLVPDVRVRIPASESCKGPLVEDPLPDYKSAAFPAFCAIDTGDLHRGLHLKIRKRNLPAFCAMDTHDLRRGSRLRIQKQLYQHSARSPQRVGLGNHTTQLYQHSVRSRAEVLRRPRIMTRSRAKCCTGHVKASSSSSFKTATLLRNRAPRLPNIASMARVHCACHAKRSPSNDTRVPTFWPPPRNTAPATISTMCPIPGTCHANSCFPAPAM